MGKVVVNGKEQQLDQTVTLFELITLNQIAQPGMVSVQLNGKFVRNQEYETTSVQDGDEVDFLYFMGGGQFVK